MNLWLPGVIMALVVVAILIAIIPGLDKRNHMGL